MTVTSQHVHALLDSVLDHPHLVLEEGQVKVVAAESAEDFRAGLTIASAAEVRSDLGDTDSPDEQRVATIAATLDQRVAELGG